MGFLKQDIPVLDFEEWVRGTRAEKIVPMARHWAEVGFGTPVVLHVFYVVKIVLYVLGGWSPWLPGASTVSPTSHPGTPSRSSSRRWCSTPCCSRSSAWVVVSVR